MELFTATGKLKFFFGNYRFSMCAPRVTRHTAIRCSSSCLTHVNMGASIFFTAAMIRAFQVSEVTWQSYFAYFARHARCTVTTDLLVWYSNTQNDFFQKRPFSHYIHSHRLAAEMWTTMKNNLLGETFWVVPSICTGFVNTCPSVQLQWIFVIPEFIIKRPVYFHPNQYTIFYNYVPFGHF